MVGCPLRGRGHPTKARGRPPSRVKRRTVGRPRRRQSADPAAQSLPQRLTISPSLEWECRPNGGLSAARTRPPYEGAWAPTKPSETTHRRAPSPRQCADPAAPSRPQLRAISPSLEWDFRPNGGLSAARTRPPYEGAWAPTKPSETTHRRAPSPKAVRRVCNDEQTATPGHKPELGVGVQAQWWAVRCADEATLQRRVRRPPSRVKRRTVGRPRRRQCAAQAPPSQPQRLAISPSVEWGCRANGGRSAARTRPPYTGAYVAHQAE